MSRKRSRRDDGASPAGVFMMFCDLLLMLVITTAALALLSLPHVNPEPKNLAEKRTDTKPITLYAYMEWTTNTPNDLDMWVECLWTDGAMKNRAIVSFMQKTNNFLDLSQDDLGRPSPANFETANSNSNITAMPPGTVCTFNVHHYSKNGGPPTMDGRFIALWKKDSPEETVIADLKFKIGEAEERTLAVAFWDKDGKLDREVSEVYPNVATKFLATNQQH